MRTRSGLTARGIYTRVRAALCAEYRAVPCRRLVSFDCKMSQGKDIIIVVVVAAALLCYFPNLLQTMLPQQTLRGNSIQ